MNENTLPDQLARDAILTVLDKTFLVEAGAGSGKTTSLVGRMTVLIASGHCRMDNMAAVTFTRKAAGELRERFQEALEKKYHNTIDPTVKHRLSTALSELDRIFIGTIHAFCSRLLRERPVEAGMAPDFTEIEGIEERALQETAWEEYLLHVRFNQPQLLQQMRDLDVSPKDLKEAYKTLLLYPDVHLPSAPAPYPDLDPVREKLTKLLLIAENAVPRRQPDNGWDKLQRSLVQALRWRRIFDLQLDRYLLRLLAHFNKTADITLNRWSDANTARQTQAYFDSIRLNVIQPALRQWYEYRYHHLLQFLLPAVRHYQAVRERENMVDFQDLLMRSASLLKHNSEVRTYFQSRYTHILVDEFQDTDPIQAEIMMFLAGTETSETDWTQLTPRPGALFVVGDPKQSIYRFRRADIDTYNRVKAQIENNSGEVLQLTTNFRSLPGIIDWVNPTFKDLLANEQAPYQTKLVPMNHIRPPINAPGIFTLPISPATRNKQETIVAEDAEKIASWIHSQLQNDMAPGDFMILVRYKSRMAAYARALEAYQIPCSISGGSDIADSRELKELSCLLKALADPDNPVPFTATLRGLFFGLSDHQLYIFKQAGGRFSFFSTVPPSQNDFIPIFETLRRYHVWTRTLPPSAALENIITDLGLIPFALSGTMGKGRTSYILQFIELLKNHETNGHTSFTAAVDFFDQLLESGMEEELDIEGGKSTGVRIMNLHRAKGLEAPVVILANPSKTASHEPTLHVSRTAGQTTGYIRITKKGLHTSETIAQPPDWDTCQQEETRYQQAEEVRLLYVAATRAKDTILISTYPHKPDLSPWHPLQPHLQNAPDLTIPPTTKPHKPVPPKPITPKLLQQTTTHIQSSIRPIPDLPDTAKLG
ncbi:MAG: UvrD-helicase domain-containing protein [Clostridium sp.]|nr:UvrD-helicase domain-containing protein [Clostridium sp.]